MILFEALPPRLYEIINVAIATSSLVALVICLRYLLAEYLGFVRIYLSWRDALVQMFQFRLAIGFTILLSGETVRMGWVWFARYCVNTHRDAAWMSHVPWVIIPVASSLTTIIGFACVTRALVPRAWGRWGYALCLSAPCVVIVLTQMVR